MRSFFPLDPLAGATLVFLIALALRLYGIEAQSLWADEGGSIALAQRPLAQITRETLQDVHPPLYYWLLHGWMQLAGTSVAAVRGLSALCGALAAALTFALARRWFGPGAASVAGLAAAVSPFAIHYSQETRMYALALLLATLAWLAFDTWAAGPRSSWRALALYWLAALALLYTHYFTAAIVAACFLAGLIALLRQTRLPEVTPHVSGEERSVWAQRPPFRRWWSLSLPWLAAHAALAALYLPPVWLSRARLAGWTATKDEIGPLFIVGDALRIFSLGPSAPPGWPPWLAGFALLLAAGLLAAGRAGGRLRAATWLLVPLALMELLSLGQPYYKPRFLLPALPAFHILIGAGAAGLARAALTFFPAWKRRGQALLVAAALFLPLAAWRPLFNEWFDPSYWRDDYRGIALAIESTAGPDDALIANGQSQIDTLSYYLRDDMPRFLLPRFRPLDARATIADLEVIARRHRRIYAISYVPEESDPAGVIPSWLDANAFMAGGRWYGDVELRIYELGRLDGGDALLALDARFGERPGLILTRAAIQPRALRPTDAARVALEWRAEGPSAAPLSMFAHLLDARGRIVAQRDGPLAATPTSAWQPGAAYQTRLAILIPPGTPPGAYRLIVGVYDPATGRRELLRDGSDALPLGELRVEQ